MELMDKDILFCFFSERCIMLEIYVLAEIFAHVLVDRHRTSPICTSPLYPSFQARDLTWNENLNRGLARQRQRESILFES